MGHYFKRCLIGAVLVLFVSAAWMVIDSTESVAQSSCNPEGLATYLKEIQTEIMEYQVKQAAHCAVKLAPSKETARILMSRLLQTLQETGALRPKIGPTNQAVIVAALAEALHRLKIDDGYDKLADYFYSADWNTWRDQWFFDRVAAHTFTRPEMTGTFLRALTRMPASAGTILGTACTVFNRISDDFVIRDDPNFIQGVLSALTRLEQGRKVPNRKAAISMCEKTLLSQLLKVKMREAFLASYLDKLTPDQQRILDRFMTRIDSSRDGDEKLMERLAKDFFAVPWGMESSSWEKSRPEVYCRPFEGNSFETNADDRWCVACSSKTEGIRRRFYFYPDDKGKACTLQKLRFSYPSASQTVLATLGRRLAERMGPGTPPTEIHGFGTFFWEDISSWSWGAKEIYAFRNIQAAGAGEGLPLVEILARDNDLISAIQLEKATQQAISAKRKQRNVAKKERLYRDVAKSLPDLVQRLEKNDDPEIKFSVLVELLPKIEEKGPNRLVQLYLADRLAGKLGEAGYTGRLSDWNAKQRVLSRHGAEYFQMRLMNVIYNHVFLKKIIDEIPTGYWGEEASLDWTLMGTDEFGYCSNGPKELFQSVITRGGDFMNKYPKSHLRKEVLGVLAQAHETGWSLSMASPNDEYVRAKAYQADAPDHLQKSIAYYERVLQEYPHSPEGALYRDKLKRLRLGLDTNSRKFFCIYD